MAPLKKKGILVCDCKKKAEIFMNQFQSVFTKEETAFIPHLDPPLHQDVSDICSKWHSWCMPVAESCQPCQRQWPSSDPKLIPEKLCQCPCPGPREYLTISRHWSTFLRLVKGQHILYLRKRWQAPLWELPSKVSYLCPMQAPRAHHLPSPTQLPWQKRTSSKICTFCTVSSVWNAFF